MAKSDASGTEGATPEKKKGAAGKRKKTIQARGEKRIVHHGLAPHHASFNTRLIGDDHRHRRERGRLVERRGHRLQGLAQGDAVRADAGALNAGNAAKGRRHAIAGRRVKGPGSGRESAIRAAADGGMEGEIDPRRDADSPQRCVREAEESVMARYMDRFALCRAKG